MRGGGDGFMPDGAEREYEESLKGRCPSCYKKHSRWSGVMGCRYCKKEFSDEVKECPDCGEKLKELAKCDICGAVDYKN